MRTHLNFVAVGWLALLLAPLAVSSCGSVSSPKHMDGSTGEGGHPSGAGGNTTGTGGSTTGAGGSTTGVGGSTTGAGGSTGAGGGTGGGGNADGGATDAQGPTVVLTGGLETVGGGPAGSMQITRASFAVLKTRVCNSTVCVSGGISP
jgi:hypothetical protein